jgi:hypothetical protein
MESSASVEAESDVCAPLPEQQTHTLGRAEHLGQEIEEGNTEFKFKLVDPTEERVQHLITQLNWQVGSVCAHSPITHSRMGECLNCASPLSQEIK